MNKFLQRILFNSNQRTLIDCVGLGAVQKSTGFFSDITGQYSITIFSTNTDMGPVQVKYAQQNNWVLKPNDYYVITAPGFSNVRGAFAKAVFDQMKKKHEQRYVYAR